MALRQVHSVNAKQVCGETVSRMGSKSVIFSYFSSVLLVVLWPVLINSELKFNMEAFIADISKLFVI